MAEMCDEEVTDRDIKEGVNSGDDDDEKGNDDKDKEEDDKGSGGSAGKHAALKTHAGGKPPVQQGLPKVPAESTIQNEKDCIEICYVDAEGKTKCVRLDCPTSDTQTKVDWKVTEAWLDWVRKFFANAFYVSPECDFALVEAKSGTVFSLNQSIPNGQYFLSQAWPVMTLPILQLEKHEPEHTNTQTNNQPTAGNQIAEETKTPEGDGGPPNEDEGTQRGGQNGGQTGIYRCAPALFSRVRRIFLPASKPQGGEDTTVNQADHTNHSERDTPLPDQHGTESQGVNHAWLDSILDLCYCGSCQSGCCCCKQCPTNDPEDPGCSTNDPEDPGISVIVSAKAAVLPGSARWALVKLEMIVDVVCDEKTDETALEFAEIRIGKPPKNPENEKVYVGWKFISAEPQNEEKTRVVNKNQGWEGGAAGGYKRNSWFGEVSGKLYGSQQWTDEVEEWRTIFSPSDVIRDNFRSAREEAGSNCDKDEQQTCSWVVCLNEKGSQRETYPSTATHSLRKYFAVVLEVKRLEPVGIFGFGHKIPVNPVKTDPTLLHIPISCIFRKRIWSRSKACGWCSGSYLGKTKRVDGDVEFELFWFKFLRVDRSFPILRQKWKKAQEGLLKRSAIEESNTETFQYKLRKLRDLVDDGDWAKEWAKSNGQHYDDNDEYRKSCLRLLYDFYDTYKDQSKEEIRTACEEFGVDKAKKILHVCLPMDRANCLYHMRLPGETPGMHWISKTDLKSKDWLKEGYNGFGSINKRYQWLVETFNLEDDKDVKKWLKPIVVRKFIGGEHRVNIEDIDIFDGGKFDNEKFGLLK